MKRNLETLGDHLRQRRLDRGLHPKEVADRIGVCVATVYNWESNATSVRVRRMPAVLRFLGYVPLPRAGDLPEALRLYRRLNGLTQGELAERIGASLPTVRRWECGSGRPGRRLWRALGPLLLLASLR